MLVAPIILLVKKDLELTNARDNCVSDKLFFGPVWDFNYAYGSTSFCEGDQVNGWQNNTSCGQKNPNWFETFLQDSTYINQLNCRWVELRNSVLSMDAVFTLKDSLIQSTYEALDRNNLQWGISQKQYDQNILTLEQWLINRLNWLDENMFGNCENTITSNNYKSILKIIDILGRETVKTGFNIEIYDDGSVKKIYIIN